MTNREIALAYLQHFCTGDIDKLAPLLAPDLDFRGPLHASHLANDYLASLRNDPPESCDHNILSITENSDEVAVFYEYKKPDRTVPIVQLFTVKKVKIAKILLMFDSSGFN